MKRKNRKDKDTIWKLNMMSTWGFDRMESWFTDMAARGWYMEKMFFLGVRFRRGEPRPGRRYRAALQYSGEISEEEKDIYEGSGWHFASHWGGINMFYSDETDAPEFFTDDASFRKKSRGFLIGLVVWLTAVLLYNVRFCHDLVTDMTAAAPLHQLNAEPHLYLLGILLVIILVVFLLFSCYQILRALWLLRRRNYRHDGPYKGTLCAANGINLMLLGALLLILLMLVLEMAGVGEKDPLTWKHPHPVTLAEFDPARDARYRDHKDDAVFTQYTDYWGETHRSLLFRQILRIRYDGSEMDNNPIAGPVLTSNYTYDAWYYAARSKDIARQYLKEEIRENQNDHTSPNDLRIPCQGVDYAGFYQMEVDSTQYLYLQKGTRLEIVTLYAEGQDLRDSLELFVRDINE